MIFACLVAVAQWLRASNIFVNQHLSYAGSSPAGSVDRDLNVQKLNYQYLTTSVAVVLVVRCRKCLSSSRCISELIDSAWVAIVPGQKCKNKNRFN